MNVKQLSDELYKIINKNKKVILMFDGRLGQIDLDVVIDDDNVILTDNYSYENDLRDRWNKIGTMFQKDVKK